MTIKNRQIFWLGISLLLTLYYGIYFYYFVFSHQYIVQDDVRQHIVWLQRFSDPQLFPQDIIAKYFYELAPLGLKHLYIWLAGVGIEPLFLAKLLPPILAIVTTVYIFLFTLEIIPVAIAGFWSSLLINQLMWLNDDLVSATARAFIYPLFAAFLYYLAKQSLIPCSIVMLLQGLFYPHISLIEIVILTLRLFTKEQRAYLWWLAGLSITAIALYPVTQKPPELATTVTLAQMQSLPEFNLGGRNVFFINWWQYYFAGSSGLSLPLFPTIVWLGIALPWLLTTKLSLINLIGKKVVILSQVTVASLTMFVIAHLLLPTLHLPSRYTYHTLRFILAISTAIVLTILGYLGKQWLNKQSQSKLNLASQIKLALVSFVLLTITLFPAIPNVFTDWFQNWQIGTAPAIYEYLAQQPKDIIVASISPEVNNIPAFAQRSILVGREFAMAYHPVYHKQIKERTIDLLQAQYSLDFQTIASFIRQYGIDYLLLDRQAFQPEYLLAQDWLINSSWSEETQAIINRLRSPNNFVLNENELLSSCSVVSTEQLNLLASDCLLSRSIPLTKTNTSLSDRN